MSDFNDLTQKQILIAQIQNEDMIDYRKMKERYKDLFNYLGITWENRDQLQKILYDFLYEPSWIDRKCDNPECNNEALFGKFRDSSGGNEHGYNAFCGKSCSAITIKRGCNTIEKVKKRVDDANEKKQTLDNWIDEHKKNKTAICHTCGFIGAQFYSLQKKTWRCEKSNIKCPGTQKKVSEGISLASKGVSRLETAETLPYGEEHICDYGCNQLSLYKLNGKDGVKYSCSPAYQSCKGARDNRSNFMTLKYQDPIAKKQFLDRINETIFNNHGCLWPSQAPTYILNRRANFEAKYGPGIINTGLIPRLREKNEQMLLNISYNRKDFIWPSGKIDKVQGYEDIALSRLLQKFTEDQIKIDRKDIPRIDYYMGESNIEKHYYPDIYIPSENLILEVKSPWTYRKDLEKNKAKEQATIDAGYNFIWLIYNGRKDPQLLNLYDLTEEQLDDEELYELLELNELLENMKKEI